MFRAPDIGIDVGNSKFSICVKGEGLVVSESAWLAYRGEYLTDASIIAIGDEAKRMYERSHPGITVMNPMSKGVVIDCRAAGFLLRRLAKKAGLRRRLAKPRAVVGALYGSSKIEQKAFIDVAESLDCRTPFVVHEPLAAAIGAHVDISDVYSNMVLDVGDGATEAVVMAQGKTILGGSIRFGGSDINTLIVDHVRKHHSLKISISQAQKIKEEITSNYGTWTSEQEITVKGISAGTLLPCDQNIPVSSILRIFEKFSEKIATFVLGVLSQVPPEVSVDLIENGIHLCGGASQSLLIREALATATDLKITFVEDPQQTVITGIGKMLEFSRLYA